MGGVVDSEDRGGGIGIVMLVQALGEDWCVQEGWLVEWIDIDGIDSRYVIGYRNMMRLE